MGQWVGAKKKGQKQSYARIKTRVDRTSFPSQVISSQKNELKIFTNVKLFTRGHPHELIFYMN